ncbi:MAG: anti-sigma factor family protein [Planctomycetales bacterium]
MSQSFDPQTFREELLSAYLDGELPGDQAAQVERWLTTSDDARQKLDEFRRLAGWIQELPRSGLPAEFAPHVMQQVERRMLLPAAPTVSSWRKARYWGLTVGAPLAAAALLLIMVRWGGDKPGAAPAPQISGGTSIASNTDHAPGAQEDEVGQDLHLVASGGAGASRSDGSAVQSEAPLTGGGGADNGAEVPPALGRPPQEQPVEGQGLTQEEEEAIERLIAQVQELSDPESIPVVTLYVVDRVDGRELVQAVLTQQKIEIAPEKSVDSTGDSDGGAPKGTAKSPETVAARQALFVVADVRQLTAAFQELQKRRDNGIRPIAQWRVQGTLKADQFDDPSRRRIEKAQLAILQSHHEAPPGLNLHRPHVATRPSEEPHFPRGAPAKGLSKNRLKSPPSTTEETPNGIANVVPSEVGAQQMVVTVIGAPVTGGSDSTAAAGAPSSGSPESGRSDATEDAPLADARPRLVQLVILVERQSESKSAPEKDLDERKSSPDGPA